MPAKHTPEPWYETEEPPAEDPLWLTGKVGASPCAEYEGAEIISISPGCVVYSKGGPKIGVEGSGFPSSARQAANAARIVACVNACKGLSNEELKLLPSLDALH